MKLTFFFLALSSSSAFPFAVNAFFFLLPFFLVLGVATLSDNLEDADEAAEDADEVAKLTDMPPQPPVHVKWPLVSSPFARLKISPIVLSINIYLAAST